ncbi:cysteine desulfurase family protein [Neobacillus thermocopriae]|uniref:Cysteine desulfurase n=1 Tax=Neobacillus thermocopriae TaxID=1215031 RepID=A0A6B3TQC5_9BACI|nr:cysteine desulfurase family protein [Neobacillus thermocopriae]MED3622753.1 cysteine desulfurase family protein [Neobacillus thermocopriae]MED3714189.1 cysteine desulfurase family protein [Neobacillus thermocopriae]NEX78596.1 cysteine desulfurase [Neobacillus thermocopriae]
MIYFDNSATTKPYKEVLDSFITVSSKFFGNPSSLHSFGGQAEKLLTQAREQTAKLLGVKMSEIYFTSGGTESNNLAIKGAALRNRNKGKHLITSSIEHPSVAKAMEQLEQEGFEITYISVDDTGRVSVDEIERAIRKDTILISIMHVNNEIGTIQPIEEIGQLLIAYPDILFHVDAVQGIGKVPLSFKNNRIDLCSISSHKFHGLKGTGALYIREGVKIDPLFSGGNQERTLRSGTENVAGAVAMAKALRLTMENGKEGIEQLRKIQTLLRDGLNKIEGLKIHTPIQYSAPHILNFSLKGIKSEVFIHALEQEDIFVSTTSACSSKKKSPSKTLLALGVAEELAESAIRISLSFENTEEEARTVIQVIEKTVNQLGKVMKR